MGKSDVLCNKIFAMTILSIRDSKIYDEYFN
jgi:hypothetical protein